jgi:hypothetical protein
MRAASEWRCHAGVMCVTDAVVEPRETRFVNTVRAKSKLSLRTVDTRGYCGRGRRRTAFAALRRGPLHLLICRIPT